MGVSRVRGEALALLLRSVFGVKDGNIENAAPDEGRGIETIIH